MKSDQIIPTHIAIIMDGNRRWARARGLPALAGHNHVSNTILEPLIEHATKRGVKYVTLWAFSTENWRRDPTEVNGIMRIFRHSIKTFGERMHKKGIQIRVIGDISRFDQDIQKGIRELVELTKHNTRITVTFALNYGGRDEIIRAIGKWHNAKCHTSTSLSTRMLNAKLEISKEEIEQYLDTVGTPDPEFIIRTSGEQRLSGFLPWQSEYSELYFPSWYMPDFTPEKLDEALEEYAMRKRRFGK